MSGLVAEKAFTKKNGLEDHYTYIPPSHITITNSAYGLLLLFARVTRPLQGLVCAAFIANTNGYLINWVEPVKNSSVLEDIPDWKDMHKRKQKLEAKGHQIIGEFRTGKTLDLTDRDRQHMKYHFFIQRQHVQLIVTSQAVLAYSYDGTDFKKQGIKPPTVFKL
ncbi:MAG: hypothetical protein ACTSW4_01895 [Candidatus Ranarchaeia archaeon]